MCTFWKIQSFGLVATILLALGSCDFTYRIKSGQEAFDVKRYAVAVEMLQSEYGESNDQKSKAYKAFLIGQSYDKMGENEDALTWYQKAAEHQYGIEALEAYAHTARRLERYDLAIDTYEQLMSSTNQTLRYRALITVCQQAREWLAGISNSEYQVDLVSFNSPGSDYGPYILGPERVVFTSDRGNDRHSNTYFWTGRSFSDLYLANTATSTVQTFDPTVNSEHNEGTIALSADRREMFFSRCFEQGEYDMYCKLMYCQTQGATWSDPVPMAFLKEGVNYGHPVFARGDSLLIFSSNDPDGVGGYDLYYSEKKAGVWQEPVLLSGNINTPGNEQFPSMHVDTLYFSSDHLPGMGGLDVFRSYLLPNGSWSQPLNLKPPVNSGWDDFGFVVDTFMPVRGNVLQTGYLSSSRQNGVGSDDIYAYVKMRPEQPSEEIITDEVTEDEKINYQIFLAIRVVEPLFEDPLDPNSLRVGKRPLSRARLNIGSGSDMRSLRTDEEGYLILEMEYEKLYRLQARFRGFLTQRREFSSINLDKDPNDPVKTYNVEFVLEPIFKDKEIILESIYYDLDEWAIRDDAKPSLDSLASILRDNPGIRIQLGSHTDCRADDDYNLELSQKRAQSAVDYLITSGIPATRLTAMGYGESQFAVDCECTDCSEEEHQKNRRTTFKVVQ